jgi:peptidoglycan-N-acetylglucosamine deacetylase
MNVDACGALERLPTNADLNILSIDVECWYQMCYRCVTGDLISPSQKSYGVMRLLLEMLRRKGVRATFFVVGYMAEAFPGLIKEMSDDGHEIASHGFTHTQLFKLTRKQLCEELKDSIDLLSNITGKPVIGFRAPQFSVPEDYSWVFHTLLELGFRYDSSIFPVRGPGYGIPSFPRYPVRVTFGDSSIIEVPLSTIHRMGANFPVSGGTYVRLLPYYLIRRAIQMVNTEGIPFVVYCHPYEFAPEVLRCPKPPEKARILVAKMMEIRSNVLRKSWLGKLELMLDTFRFGPIKEVLKNELRE